MGNPFEDQKPIDKDKERSNKILNLIDAQEESEGAIDYYLACHNERGIETECFKLLRIKKELKTFEVEDTNNEVHEAYKMTAEKNKTDQYRNALGRLELRNEELKDIDEMIRLTHSEQFDQTKIYKEREALVKTAPSQEIIGNYIKKISDLENSAKNKTEQERPLQWHYRYNGLIGILKAVKKQNDNNSFQLIKKLVTDSNLEIPDKVKKLLI